MWQWCVPSVSLFLLAAAPLDNGREWHFAVPTSDVKEVFYLDGRTEARFQVQAPSDEQLVRICGLHPGHDYRLWVVAPPEAAFEGRPVLHKQRAPSGMLPGNRPSGKWWGNYHKFVAEGECLDIAVRGRADRLEDKALFVSIQCTDCRQTAAGAKGGDQPELPVLSVVPQSHTYLIENVLVGGGCFSISGITPIGPSAGRGEFFNGLSSVGFDHGVILESGSIFNAPGPNNSDEAGNDMGSAGDPDLNILGAGPVFDAVGIEFDFTPTIDTVTFNYVFASEEYCEFVNSTYNDVFGFFISGPGFNGGFTFNGVNIALVPGTGQFVAINTVNHLQNQAYFNPNQGNCGGTTNMTDIQFDGFTTILTATAVVIPCETYHIRLVVGDVGDGIYDSAVFLEANSFTPGNVVAANVVTLAGSSGSTATIYEGCTGNFIVFERQSGDNSQPVDITYVISSSSTATPGLDYDPLPTTITIPAGQDTIMVPFTAFADGIPEGVETVIIELDNPCTCSSNQVVIQIEDVDLQVTLPDVTGCSTTPAVLTPGVSGGPEPYTYSWSTGATSPTITVNPPAGVPTTYTVTVTDACGNVQTGSATVTLDPPPTAVLTGNGTVCGTGTTSVDLTVSFTGSNGPWVFVYAINGVAQAPVTTSANPYTLTIPNVTSGTVIELLSVDYANGSCPGGATGSVTIVQVDLQVTATAVDVSCAGNADGQIAVSVTGGSGNYTYQWSGGLPGVANPSGVAPGTYVVTVTDLDQNCTGTATVTVEEPPPLNVSVDVTPVNCNGGGTATVTVSGGTPTYTYTWTGGLSGPNPSGLPAGTYELTVADANGCTQTASITIGEDLTPPVAVASANGTITCATPELTLSGNGSSTGASFTYQWSGPGIVSGGHTLNPVVDMGGTYTLVVTNTDNGCTATATVTVPENTTPPVATATGGTVTCYNPTIVISGAGSSTGGPFTYQWSGPGILLGGQSLNPIVNAGGTYTLVVTDTTNGCTATATVTVFENTTPPQANATGAEITCVSAEVSLSGTGSSIGPNFSYQWSGPGIVSGANGLFPVVDQTGTYTLIVTNAVNGCTDTATAVVTENTTPPQAVILPPAPLSCAVSSITLSGSGSSTGHHTYQWDGPGIVSGGQTLNPVVDAAGTYTLVVTDNLNGCTDTASVTVVDNSNPPVAVATASNNIDCAHATATLSSAGSSTGPGIQYTWTGPGIVSGQFSPTALVNQAGTYVLSVYDANSGCSSSAAVVVSSDATPPVVQIAQPPPFDCQTQWVTLQAAGTSSGSNYSYVWTTADGVILTGQGTLTPLVGSPGTYVLEVTNVVNGCTAADSVMVVADTVAPLADAGPAQQLDCATTEVTLQGSATTASGPPQFQWSGPGIVSGAQTATPLVNQGGVYTLVLTDAANGCTDTATVVVTENSQLPAAVIQPPPALTCQDTAVVLDGTGSASGLGISYSWTTPDGIILSGAQTLNPLVGAPGTYVLNVFDTTSQCSNSTATTVQAVYNYPTVAAGPDKALTCSATEVTLDATGSDSGPGLSIGWTTPDGNILSGAQTLTPLVNEAGTYILSITDSLTGCTAADTAIVTVDADVPVADAGPDLTFNCLTGATLTIDASASSVGPTYTYSWTTSDGLIVSGDSTLQLVVAAAGTYQLMVTNQSNGCTAFSTVIVAEDYTQPEPLVSVSGIISCAQGTVWLDASASANADLFAWSTNDGLILSDTSGVQVEVAAAGMYLLHLTNLTSGCAVVDTVWVYEDFTSPVAEIAPSQAITCADPQITLDATASAVDSLTIVSWSTQGGQIVAGDSTLTPVVAAGGNYLLTLIHQESGCVDVATIQVAENLTPPQVEAGLPLTLDCTQPQAPLQGQATPGSVLWWTTADGHIVSGDSTLQPLVSAAGVYVLHALDPANGCMATDTVEVVHTGVLPPVAIQPPLPITCAQPQVVLDATASNPDPSFLVAWHTTDGHILSGEQTLTPVVGAAGTYTLSITNPDNGCIGTQSVEVLVDTVAPQAFIEVPPLMGCGVSSLWLDASASDAGPDFAYQWHTPDGTILSGADSAFVEVGSGGTYALTLFDLSNGCQTTAEVQVVQDTVMPAIDLGPDLVLTCAADTLFVEAQVGGMLDRLVFSWHTLAGQPLDLDGPQAVLTEAGTYVLFAEDTLNHCTAADTLLVEVDVNLPQVLIATPQPFTCQQQQVLLDGQASDTGPGFVYSWSTADGVLLGDTTGLVATAASPGTYTLSIWNPANECVHSAQVTVLADTLPPEAAILPPPVLSCAEPQIVLTGQVNTPFPFSVQWQASAGGHISAGVQSLTPSVDSPGQYVMRVTHLENGCSTEVEVEVFGDFEAPVPQIAAPAVLTCDTAVSILDASASVGDSLAFSWTTHDGLISGESQMAVVQAVAPGTYALLLTDLSNGCIASDTVVVEQDTTPPTVHIQVSGMITCAQQAVDLLSDGSSTGPQFAYQWLTPDGLLLSDPQQANAVAGAAGHYQLSILNTENGCEAAANAVVEIDTVAPVVSVTDPPPLTCDQPVQVIEVEVPSPLDEWSIHWTTADGHIVGDAQAATIEVDGQGTYEVEVVDLTNGCTSVASVYVAIDTAAPVVALYSSGVLTCDQPGVVIELATSPPPVPLELQWYGPDGQILGSNLFALEVSQPGWYQVVATHPGNGCEGMAAYEVVDGRVYPQIEVSDPQMLTCETTEVVLQASVVPDTGIGAITWSTNDGHIVSGAQTLTALVDEPGLYQLSVVHEASGCVGARSIEVAADRTMPQVDAGPDLHLDCHHTEVTLQGMVASGGEVAVSWTTDEGHIVSGAQTLQPLVDAPGVYRLLAQHLVSGCTAEDEVTVTRVLPEEILVEVIDPLCHGHTGAISVLSVEGGMPPYSYSLDGEDFSPTPVFSGVPPGTYAVLALDANGCVVSDTVEVVEPDPIELWIDSVGQLQLGDSLLLEVHTNLRPAQIASVSWSPAEGLSCDTCLVTWAKPLESNWYTVVLVDLNGCTAQQTTFLRVDRRPAIYVPNAFSPNGDGYNDRFYPFAKPGVVREVRAFLVFDRWGEAVYRYEHFQPNDPAAGWDGTHRGQPMDPQVLVWYAEVELVDGRVVVLKGDVTLVR